MAKKDQVVVLGSLNYDMIFRQQRMPEIGETYTADSLQTASGGKGANQAVQCARLGIPVYLAGAVGRDASGSWLLEQLQGYGVHTEYVGLLEECTGVGMVNCLQDGSVRATIYGGANARVSREAVEALRPLLADSRILILQLEIPVDTVACAVAAGRESDCYVILNAAPARSLAAEVLAGVDCLVVNETEASFYWGQPVADFASAELAARELITRVRDTVIITLGGQGSLVCRHNGRQRIPACRVKAVETTGAGDSYIGAYAAALLRGQDAFAAARFAAAAAAITVQGVGAQPSMPSREDIDGFLAGAGK